MKKILLTLISLALITVIYSQDITEEMYVECYVVIVDTSDSYFDLNKTMSNISEEYKLTIDTMDRFFDSEKNLICLPNDYEDDIYAGSYFPRRFSTEFLSIEYYYYYVNGDYPEQGSNAVRLMCLVSMIDTNKEKAEERHKLIKMKYPKSFILKTKIYWGCMH